MSRRLRLVLSAALGALVLVPGAGAGRADNPVLTGDVGANDAFSISLADASGPVTHLDPGTYTIVVHDHSAIHDFHLSGPGVDVATDVGGVGDVTWTVTLMNGVYTYVCDPHLTVMKGSFTVGNAPTSAPKPVAKPVAKLTARVGPGKTISLHGAAGATAGRFAIVVSDRSAKDNFHLVGPGVSKATGVGFRGTVTWKVALRAGRYVFRSDRTKTLRGAFEVAGG